MTDAGSSRSGWHLAVFMATSGHSGVDRIARNLLPELSRQGVKVDLLAVDGHGPDPAMMPQTVRVVRLGSRHATTSLWRLVRYLRRERPDAILSDKDRVNRTALLACRLARAGTRCVVRLGTTVSVNLAGKNRWERWVQTMSIRYFYGRAEAIVVPSIGVADDLAGVFGVSRGRIHVIPNPVVASELAVQAREPVQLPWETDVGAPVIIGVGEFSGRKDFATLLRAFGELRRERVCRLVLVGDGPQRGALEALASDLGVADDVHWPGFVGNPYAYMGRSAVLGLTSQWEGMGIVLAEALALGLQVVATDCPSGPREVLRDGEAGFLAPVGDHHGVADALRAALDTPRSREILAMAAAPYRIEPSARHYRRVLGLDAGLSG